AGPFRNCEQSVNPRPVIFSYPVWPPISLWVFAITSILLPYPSPSPERPPMSQSWWHRRRPNRRPPPPPPPPPPPRGQPLHARAARPRVEPLEDRVTPAPFTPGNLAIYRVGDGAGSLANTGNAVFLDEYTPTGTLVQSVAMPTTASGSNKQLIASGTATSEGLLTRSADGRYLLLTGYGRDLPGSGSVVSTASATVPRVVGRVDPSATIDTSTALSDFADGSNPRSVTSTNGTDLWVAGAAGGVRYATLGSTTSTQLSTTVTNIRQTNIFAGQLYVSDSSGSAVRVGAVGSGLPTTSGQTITNLSGFPTSGGPYGFFFADLSASVDGLDTL